MSPPRGRPPADHVWDEVRCGWAHVVTGEVFDAEAHVLLVRAKKHNCMQRLYWERGGRRRRLARYTKKHKPKAKQLTLPPNITASHWPEPSTAQSAEQTQGTRSAARGAPPSLDKDLHQALHAALQRTCCAASPLSMGIRKLEDFRREFFSGP